MTWRSHSYCLSSNRTSVRWSKAVFFWKVQHNFIIFFNPQATITWLTSKLFSKSSYQNTLSSQSNNKVVEKCHFNNASWKSNQKVNGFASFCCLLSTKLIKIDNCRMKTFNIFNNKKFVKKMFYFSKITQNLQLHKIVFV